MCLDRSMGMSHSTNKKVLIIAGVYKGLTPLEVAQYLGISRCYVDKLVAEGELPCGTLDGRISYEALQVFVEQRETARRVFAEEVANLQASQAEAVQELMRLM